MLTQLALAFTLLVSTAHAQAPPRPTQEDRARALAAIQGWTGFEGIWDGELKYVAAPVEAWFKMRMPFKLVMDGGLAKAYYQDETQRWTELGSTYQVLQPDKLTLVVYAHSAGGVWTQGNMIVLTRRTENTAKVFVQRVVNNWVVPAQPSEDPVFGDTRTGEAERLAPVPARPSSPPSAEDDALRSSVDSSPKVRKGA
jgi:hypothetical protein